MYTDFMLYTPTKLLFGCGKLNELGNQALPGKKALLLISSGKSVKVSGTLDRVTALLDRLFYSSADLLRYKPAAAVAVCRRGGASAAFDRLNKYFTIAQMPVVSSQYWNILYGARAGETSRDAEGLQTMRTLGRNMAWMLKSLSGQPLPEREPAVKTNFIR